MNFQELILQGVPTQLPHKKTYDPQADHAPRRKDILDPEEKKLAVRNALRWRGNFTGNCRNTAVSICTALNRITRCTPGLSIPILHNASRQQA